MFTKENVNCSADDFIYDYFGTWYLMVFAEDMYGGKYTVEKDILDNSCHKYIQSIFGGHLREIMAIMAYSLSDNGYRFVQKDGVDWVGCKKQILKCCDLSFI